MQFKSSLHLEQQGGRQCSKCTVHAHCIASCTALRVLLLLLLLLWHPLLTVKMTCLCWYIPILGCTILRMVAGSTGIYSLTYHVLPTTPCRLLPPVALKPDVFEGLRFEITRPLNQNFFLTHRCTQGQHTVSL